MKRARFSEAQIIGILRENEAGAKAGELARKHGVSEGRTLAPRGRYSQGQVTGPDGALAPKAVRAVTQTFAQDQTKDGVSRRLRLGLG